MDIELIKYVCYSLNVINNVSYNIMPIKDRKSKILLVLALFGDLQQKQVEFNEKILDLFDLTLNQKTKGTLSSFLKSELIEIIDQDNVLKYTLTNKGLETLSLHFPLFRYQVSEWDGVWRIISYEIPERKRELRDRLRREMSGWGLGPWHRSFWITPHPIISALKNLVYGKEEAQYIQAFEATHMFGEKEILIEKVWNKIKLEQGYRELFKLWHSTLAQDVSQIEKFKIILYSYIAYIRNDPGLPQSLLGQNWIGYEAYAIFKEIRDLLLK